MNSSASLLDYLEILPLRPQKENLEALTSLVTKVMVANGFGSWHDFCNHVSYKPSDADRADKKESNWQKLAKLLILSIDEIREMTTYYLEQKFQHDQALVSRNLLQSCFSPHLRFCSQCLAQDKIYSLVWAFNFIPGCIKHGCYFHEKCPFCDKTISRLPNCHGVGICPHCEDEFSKSKRLPLTPEDYLVAKVRTYDIENLLVPRIFNASIGNQLKSVRESRGIEFNEICRVTLWNPWKLRFLENGPSVSYLENYLQYADYLGLTLSQVMRFPEANEVDQDFDEFFSQQQFHLLNKASEFEKNLVSEASSGFKALRRKHIRPNQVNLRQSTNLQYPRLTIFPSIKPLFIEAKLEFKENETQRKDLEMLDKLKDTVEFLRASGFAPFWQEVLTELDLSVNSLQGLPRCLEFSAEVISYSQECSTMIDRLSGKMIYVHVSIIMARTQALIDYALLKRLKLSASDIQKEIGFRKGLIERHKPLRDLIQDYTQKVSHLKKRRRSRNSKSR